MDWKKINHFRQHEFFSPDQPGSGENMNEEFVKKLDLLRMFYGKPVYISSGYRTKEHNLAVGGVSDSAHLKGLAADLSCNDSRERFEIVRIALIIGIRRIGIANTFVHIDSDETKDQDIIWLY